MEPLTDTVTILRRTAGTETWEPVAVEQPARITQLTPEQSSRETPDLELTVTHRGRMLADADVQKGDRLKRETDGQEFVVFATPRLRELPRPGRLVIALVATGAA